MLTPENARARAEALVEQAIAAGASAADAVYICDATTEVQVRLGSLEDVGRSESEGMGLRVFLGQRSASVSASDLSPASLATLVDRALDMARIAPEDPFAGLAPADMLLAQSPGDYDLDDPATLPPEAMRDLALTAEDAARAIPGVTNSEGAGVSAGRSISAIATSHGFSAAKSGSSFGLSASVLAGTGGDMQRDYAYHMARYLADLDSPEAIGTRAGTRAVERVNPGKIASRKMPVVFATRVSGSIIGHLLGAISGSAIARKTSFLLDALDTPVFAPGISIVDDPHRMRGLRSRGYDGEGLPTRPIRLIDQGMLTGWMMDSASARQLGLAPTGHASRGLGGAPGTGASNVHLENGSVPLDDLIADIETGFYVTDLIGHGVNMVTGDYSRGANGFRIENGQIAGPVAEITIAGNLRDMFAALIPANDLDMRHAVNAPSLRIDGMTVASG